MAPDLEDNSRHGRWPPARTALGPEVSVVIPARDEAASVPVLAREIEEVLDATGLAWECIWIDDGSTDETLATLQRLAALRPEHRWISLDGNHGQSAALLIGFEQSVGEIVVTLDADLQNDPRDIPRLVEAVRRDRADMATGVRALRQDRWIRRVSSRVANGFRNWITGDRIRDVGCSLRAFRRGCARNLPFFHGMHRFLPTLVRTRGFRVVEIEVGHRPRRFGRTKYGIGNRLWVGIIDTLMIRWLIRRQVRPVVRQRSLPWTQATQIDRLRQERPPVRRP